MPYDMKTLALDTTAATSATILFGAINGQTDTQPIPIPINIIGTYTQANFGATPANPTASVGLAAVNGTATTVMRSDAAPALSQAIAPTWTGQHVFNNAITQLGSTSQLQWSTDLILTRSAAATLQFGSADTNPPVAQSLRVQGATGSNIGGANTTFIGSLSTGSGTSGDFIFQTGGTGAGAAVQNTPTTALTIKGATQAVIATGPVLSGGSVSGAVAGDLGASRGSATGALFLGTDGTTFLFRSATTIAYLAVNNTTAWDWGSTISGVLSVTSSNLYLQGNSLAFGSGSTQDTFVRRAAAATLQLGAADAATATAQTLQVQNVAAGNSNVNGANWTINGSVSTGTGTSGDIIFQTGGTGAGATSQNAEVTALTIKGATQQVILATNLRINVTPTANTSASTTITNGADSSTNLGHRLSFNFNGTTYWIPCGSTAF